MRILHVIPSLAAAHGGPSRAMRLIDDALRGEGVDVETATTDDDGAGGRDERVDGEVVFEGGAKRRYFRKALNPYTVSMSLFNWLRTHVGDYDLVHIHALFSFSSTAAAWAARMAGVPYVVRPLGTLTPYGMARRRPWLKRLSLEFVEGPILGHAAAVHFTSGMEEEEALSLGVALAGSVVIPLGVEGVLSAPPGPLVAEFPALAGKRWVLYLSRLAPKKNVEALLQAVVLCAPDLPGVCWILAGEGDRRYADRLHSLARELGVNDRIVWTGHLDGSMKAEALTHSELFVLPSLSENFCIAAAEALHAGLPVVLGEGVALSTEAEAVGAGKAVEPEPRAIAIAMEFYLRDPTARAAAAANARTFAVNKFSLKLMGARLVALYEDILTNSRETRRGR